jgi:riboflavin biosynthesis pyrimidine reductase
LLPLSFSEFAARKTSEAEAASIAPLQTVDDRSAHYDLQPIGSAWTMSRFDGPFYVAPVPDGPLPGVSLVFVQSADGNTAADDPADLGGGDIDKHLIYEGLSRVAADAVLAGATTAAAPNVFFSLWHPELRALRRTLARARHPAQIVVTGRACFNAEECLIFNVPDAPVFVLGSEIACAAIAEAARTRPWVTVIPLDRGLRGALTRLRREHGIQRISAIGGRTTATALVDEGLVQELYLTIGSRTGGEPNTPWYVGKARPRLDRILMKRGAGADGPISFEHLNVSGGRS